MASTVVTLGPGTHTIRLAASGGTATVSGVTMLLPTLAPAVSALQSPTSDDPVVVSGRVPSLLEAEIQGAATAAANLIAGAQHHLAAALAGSATIAAALTAPRPLAAALTAFVSVAANLTASGSTGATLAPVVAALTSPVGTEPIVITGTVPASVEHPLGAELGASAVATATLQLPISHPLAVEIVGRATAQVDLHHPAPQPLAAELVASATVSAIFGFPYTGPRKVAVTLSGPTARVSLSGPTVRMYLDDKG